MISNILHIKAIVYLLRSDRHSRDCGEWLEFLVSCTINHCSKRRENRSSWNLAEVWSFKKKDLSLSPYDLHFIWHLTIAFPMKFLCFLHCAIYSKIFVHCSPSKEQEKTIWLYGSWMKDNTQSVAHQLLNSRQNRSVWSFSRRGFWMFPIAIIFPIFSDGCAKQKHFWEWMAFSNS